ncbi:hypothetical protein KUTeg_019650, partial [Tegillarca granosa]
FRDKIKYLGLQRHTTTAIETNVVRPFTDIPGPGGIYNIPYIGILFNFVPFSNQGTEWASIRKPATEQMLKPKTVQNYIPIINTVADDFIEKLKRDGRIDDCLKEMVTYTTESKDKPRICNIPVNKGMYSHTCISNLSQEMISTRRQELDAQKKDGIGIEDNEPDLLHALLSDPRITTEQAYSLIDSLFLGGVDSTDIMIIANPMSENDNFFPNPKEFLPERWLRTANTNGVKTRNIYPFSSIPFGYGPRSCIGQRFAENQIYVAITKASLNKYIYIYMFINKRFI